MVIHLFSECLRENEIILKPFYYNSSNKKSHDTASLKP